MEDLLAGRPDRLGPLLRRIVAPNPSALTGAGTNSYLLGEGRLALIDPGPRDARHAAALREALGPAERICWIIVTHRHRDHAPLAREIAQWSGAPILAGPRPPPRPLPDFARGIDLGGGEGIDPDFVPDLTLRDGDEITGDGWTLSALHTPGHLDDHLCLLSGDGAFSGDHVMGWATSLVSPPDGDMGDYLASLDRLARTGVGRLWPGHGAPVEAAQARIAELAAHRAGRAEAMLRAIGAGTSGIGQIVAQVYADTPPALHPAATRNVLAHLIHLTREGRVATETPEVTDLSRLRFVLPDRA